MRNDWDGYCPSEFQRLIEEARREVNTGIHRKGGKTIKTSTC